jgi:hypothetical protein
MPSMSRQRRSSFPSVRRARATLKITSIPSDKKTSMILHATGNGSAVVKSVRNQLDAYMLV